MHIGGLRIPVIILSTCLALGILFGGHWIYQNYFVLRPLVNELHAVPGVEKVIINEKGTRMTVDILLKEKVDLKETYSLIEDLMAKVNSDELQFQIEDRSNEKLENLFYQSQYCIYEALMQGNFTDMSKNIEKIMQSAEGVKWRLNMDLHYIYLEMHDGDHYLYKVIPRQQQYPMEVAF